MTIKFNNKTLMTLVFTVLVFSFFFSVFFFFIVLVIHLIFFSFVSHCFAPSCYHFFPTIVLSVHSLRRETLTGYFIHLIQEPLNMSQALHTVMNSVTDCS